MAYFNRLQGRVEIRQQRDDRGGIGNVARNESRQRNAQVESRQR